MQFKMEITTNEIAKSLAKLPNDIISQAAERALVAGGEVIVAYAKINAAGQGLQGKTGHLINSIKVYDPSPESVLVGSRGVIYAAVHEFGATIRPKRAKMLHWVNEEGEDVFAMQSVIPERAYLRPAIDEHKSEVLQAMGNVIRQYL